MNKSPFVKVIAILGVAGIVLSALLPLFANM
jgi:hypothetical protein